MRHLGILYDPFEIVFVKNDVIVYNRNANLSASVYEMIQFSSKPKVN